MEKNAVREPGYKPKTRPAWKSMKIFRSAWIDIFLRNQKRESK